MCGIVGFIGQGTIQNLENMVAKIRHRGPDEQGIFYRAPVALGHARLAILDLAGGQQPMSNEAGDLTVVFNGEIYNFQELRGDLEKRGYKFKTNSDTEVILHSYAAYGENCLKYFNGMFAFALWDDRNRQLFLARDRVGKKPLYWTYQKNNFVFASELKALQVYPYLDFVVDREQLKKYFFYDYIPCPHTPWQRVFKLEPAQYLIFKNGQVKTGRYWQPSFGRCEALSFNEALARFDQLLLESVKYRLISDVPLGIFLSGGIDSSTVAWYASQAADKRIKTFSVDFKEKTFGEGQYAGRVAKLIGSDHREATLSVNEALELVPKLGRHLDEPLADASLVPTYLLSDFTRKYVTVALGGDGADELFCGYQTFLAERFYQFYRQAPAVFKKMAVAFSRSLPVSHKYFGLDFKLNKFLQAAPESLIRHQNWLSSFSLEDINLLTGEPGAGDKVLWDIYDFEREAPPDRWSKIIAFYQRFYMQERVLVKVDRASMLAALEVRAPFLDWRLVNFVNSLPLNYKFRGLTTKYLLKQLMRNRLPAEIVNRPKKGFALPLAEWFTGPLKEMFADLASKDNIEKSGILRYDYVASLLENHLTKRENNGQKLWSILMFLFWQESYVK
jgi:asparagine synthase (glutamine-hydrolysing)